MIAYAALFVLAVALVVIVRLGENFNRQILALAELSARDRQEWAKERHILCNRIQAPSALPVPMQNPVADDPGVVDPMAAEWAAIGGYLPENVAAAD